MHPPVEGCSALLAAAAGFDSHDVRDSLDHVTQADFLLDKKPRKPHPMRLAFSIAYRPSLSLLHAYYLKLYLL